MHYVLIPSSVCLNTLSINYAVLLSRNEAEIYEIVNDGKVTRRNTNEVPDEQEERRVREIYVFHPFGIFANCLIVG